MKRALCALAVLCVVFLAACSSQPTASVDTAECYPATDKSEEITTPTQFVKLTMSSDDRVAAVVDVILYDSSGNQIDRIGIAAGPVFQGEPNLKVIPLNTNRRITEATESCAASVVGYGVPSPEGIG